MVNHSIFPVCVTTAYVSVPKVMVRPRIGDFVYSDTEIQTMLQDIAIFKDEGVSGVVLGVLDRFGRVDVIWTRW